MTKERTLYLERSPWPTWAAVLVWGATAMGCFTLLQGWEGPLPLVTQLLTVVVFVLFAVCVTLVLGGLTVRVHETEILVHLGSASVLRTRVPFSEIESTESVTYRPIREFGGWGMRGWGRRKAWSVRGNRAVSLGLSGGRELLIGSDHPQRLEERIRAAMDARPDSDAST